MPNEVYLRAHHGLSTLVSARVATRLLDTALRSRQQSPEDVDGDMMGRLLLGPILHELESALPADGLRRNLGRLAQQLRRLDAPAPPPAEEVQALPPDPPPPAVPKAVVYFDDDDEPMPAPAARPPLSEAVLERMVLAFAHLDHVQQVAALRQSGEVVLARGAGVDLPTLSRLGLLGLKLLSRSGQLRSYYLAHSCGQLFLFPLGADTLVVVGAPELTIGAVLATYAGLKEEL